MVVRSTLKITIRGNDPYIIDAAVIRGHHEEAVAQGLSFAWQATTERDKLLQHIRDGNGSRDQSTDQIRLIGKQLYDALFPDDGPLAQMLKRERETAYGRGIRLSLVLEADKLKALPWESLYHREFLAARGDLPIVRVTSGVEVGYRAPILGTLHVLLVTASPVDPELLPLKNLDEMAARLKTAIERKDETHSFLPRRIEVTHLAGAGVKTLSEEISRNPSKYHIICFACHGSSEALYLENGEYEHERDPLSARDFVQMLNTDRFSVRMIYLMACETGRVKAVSEADNDDPTSTVPLEAFAIQLSAQGEIAAVVATQTKVSYAMIEAFTVDFFRRIAAYRPIDVAIAEARYNLFIEGSVTRDFIAPVMYLQTADSRLFRSAVPRLLVALIVVIILAVGATGTQAFFNGLQTEFQRREQETLQQQEAESRVQLAGFLSQREEWAVGQGPQAPILINQSVWVSSGDGVLRGFQLIHAVEPVDVSVGAAPGMPVADGDHLWIVSTTDKSVTRVASDGSTQTFRVGRNPNDPLIVGGNVWVQSRTDHTLTRIDPSTGTTQSVSTGFDPGEAFAGGNRVWVPQVGQHEILGFGVDQRVTFTVAGRINAGLYAGQWLWLQVDDDTLLKVDPETGVTIGQVAFPVPVAMPVVYASGILWALDQPGNRVFSIDPDQPNASPVVWSVDGPPRRLFTLLNRLWVTTDNDQVVVFDLASRRRLATLPAFGSTSINQMVDDGENVWFVAPGEDQVIIVRAQDGAEVRRVRLCHGARGPVFDGLNMWLSCTGAGTGTGLAIRVPPIITYVGPSGVEDPTQSFSYTPVIQEGRLWLPQSSTGHILIFEGQNRLADVSLGSPITALVADESAVWAATKNGQIVRMTPRMVQRDLVDQQYNLSHFEVVLDRQMISGEVNSLHVVGDYIWALHTDITNLQDSDSVTVIQRQTLRSTAYSLGVPSGWLSVDGDVWLTTARLTTGVIDHRTAAGTEIARYHLPATTAVSWAPVLLNGNLWFVTGAKPVNEILSLVRSLFTCQPDDRIDGLYRFDLSLMDFVGQPYQTLCAPSAATTLGSYLWFTSNAFPVINQPNDEGASGVFAVDVRDGHLYGPWQSCPDTGAPMVAAGRVWIGCRKAAPVMTVLAGDPPQPQKQFPSVGIDPWPPVEQDGVIWFTFRASDSAAAFDAVSGDLLGVYGIGRAPGPPFEYNGQVWVYTLQDGILQRLSGGKAR